MASTQMTKRYTVPFTGTVNLRTLLSNTPDTRESVKAVTGRWLMKLDKVTNDLSNDPDDEELVATTVVAGSWDYDNGTVIVEMEFPSRYEARFDGYFSGKTNSAVLADLGWSAPQTVGTRLGS